MIEKKVLFVEDSPTMRRIIANSLKKIGFSDFVEAENGSEMNGEVLVKKLRDNDKYKDTPILMSTTRGMKDDVIKAVKIGVNGYVVKPFTPEILRKKINDIIN